MTTAAPDAPPTTAGSAPAPPERYACDVCGREFTAKIALFNHRKKHDSKAGEGPGVDPDIKVQRAGKIGQKELAEIQAELGENIRMVGGVLHSILVSAKVARLQHPDGRVPIPGLEATLPLPAVETHLAYALISRSELTAKVLVQHAESNETLLKWIVRVNGWFKGGEVSGLVGAHVVAAAATVGVGGPIVGTLAGALIGDIVDQVEQENRELRHQVAQLQAQVAGAATRRNGDERGAGN